MAQKKVKGYERKDIAGRKEKTESYDMRIYQLPEPDEHGFYSISELQKEYKKLQQTANKRLYRLEQYSKESDYENVLKYAYAKAMTDIKLEGGERRFKPKPPENAKELMRNINDMLTFLNSPSSTKKGIQMIYQKRADTINEKYGTSFTWQTLADYYETGLASKMDKEFGSKTALQSIGVFQANKDKIVQAMKDKSLDHIKLENQVDKDGNPMFDEVTMAKAQSMLQSKKKRSIRSVKKVLGI